MIGKRYRVADRNELSAVGVAAGENPSHVVAREDLIPD